jgi:hypothetical protein
MALVGEFCVFLKISAWLTSAQIDLYFDNFCGLLNCLNLLATAEYLLEPVYAGLAGTA